MPPEKPVNKPATLRYIALAALFLATVAYQTKHIIFIAEYLSGRVVAVTAPGSMQNAKPIVSSVAKEAEKAGVRVGDTLLEVNGTPYRGVADIVRAIEYARGGDSLRVTVQHKDGARRETVLIPLVERKHDPSDYWLFAITLHVLLPLLCAVLGFWVTALRPRERMAWILLALLVGFSQMFGITMENADGTLANNLAMGYKGLFSSTWVLWLFLLGLYFPEPLEFERRHPWIKWW